ncbi:MAG: hypothetical protein K2M42_10665 [Oscillospiraceae bacterium]|nr:hypothetical protein [Oscillospiraceae bacterium]
MDEQGAALPGPQTGEQGASDTPKDRHSPGIIIRPSGERLIRWPSGHPANDRSGGASAAHASAVHLDEQGWVHNARVLSMAVCAIGLLLALGGWLHEQTSGPLIIGLIIQVLGLLLFELAVPRMGSDHKTARLTFYIAANWLVLPIPTAGLCWWIFDYAVRPYHSLLTWAVFLSCDLMFSAAVTAVLGWLRWRQTHKK